MMQNEVKATDVDSGCKKTDIKVEQVLKKAMALSEVALISHK